MAKKNKSKKKNKPTATSANPGVVGRDLPPGSVDTATELPDVANQESEHSDLGDDFGNNEVNAAEAEATGAVVTDAGFEEPLLSHTPHPQDMDAPSVQDPEARFENKPPPQTSDENDQPAALSDLIPQPAEASDEPVAEGEVAIDPWLYSDHIDETNDAASVVGLETSQINRGIEMQLSSVNEVSAVSVIWYCSGTRVDLPLGETIDRRAQTTMAETLPNYIPTLWEPWESFFSEQRAIQEDQRDLQKIICFFSILKISGGGQAQIRCKLSSDTVMDLQPGDNLIAPAIDFPPQVFKRDYRRRKRASRLPLINQVLVEGDTQVLAIMSYWQRVDLAQ